MSYIGWPYYLEFESENISYLKPYEKTTPKMYIMENGELESKTYTIDNAFLMESKNGTMLVEPGSGSHHYLLYGDEIEHYKSLIK
jgi:hypothetical protein